MAKSALNRLRSIMQNTAYVSQKIEAYIIPSCDSHQNEYISDCDKRMAFISGFTGSAGTAVVTLSAAALWTDGRYYLQAQKELSADWTLMNSDVGAATEGDWLLKVLPAGSKVGMDPFLMSFTSWKKLSKLLSSSGHGLLAIEKNLIDIIWEERPPIPNNPVFSLPTKYTGLSWEEKVKIIRKEMEMKKVTVLLLSALDEIAWLLNLRGSDVKYNPVFFSYAALTMSEIHLFIDEQKLVPSVKETLCSSAEFKVIIHSYESIMDFLRSLQYNEGIKVLCTRNLSHALGALIPKPNQTFDVSPVALKKAIKNAVEIECMKNAHVKDAVAICQLFSWLEKNIKTQNITEVSAAKKLEEYRREQDEYVGQSFDTISASGPNASIIHYRPNKRSDRAITAEEVYLCDTGSQFRDGTTDVTRTLHFGTPTVHEKECYTRVLKGHIALSSATFPKLTKGHMLDTLARKSLWDVGLDYLHGTGHGVGLFLNVHEGPMGIASRAHPDDPGFQEGMILSIEPGYYEDDEFGIRIENLAVVVKADTRFNFRNKDYLTFEPLTLVPMQMKMIVPSLLSEDEVRWLNDYHVRCREVIGNALLSQGKHETHKWLLSQTQPLG